MTDGRFFRATYRLAEAMLVGVTLWNAFWYGVSFGRWKPKYFGEKRFGACECCGERRLLMLVEKTGYEGWFCKDCETPPLECTCYEAHPGHMPGCPMRKQ